MPHHFMRSLVKLKVKSPCSNWAPRSGGVLGSGGIAPRILDLGTRWRRVVSFTPQPLNHQGKSPWYPLDWRLDGTQIRSGHSGEENSQPLQEFEPLIIQPVAQCCTTELPCLLRSLVQYGLFQKNLVSQAKGRMQIEGVWEWGAEGNIWNQEGGRGGRLEKTS
jgi:hypothetical protein